jgi:hypothetical protein
MSIAPPVCLGYLTKLGHMVKSWKKRYFVLEMGRLTYFEKAVIAKDTSSPSLSPPYGVNQKGCMVLTNVQLQESDQEDDRNPSNVMNQIYLVHMDTGKDLLLSAPDYQDAQRWKEALQAHILFATIHADLAYAERDSMTEEIKKTRRASMIVPAPAPVAEFRSNSDPSAEKDPGEAAGMTNALEPGDKITIKPTAGFVIKTRREGGMKVFINVCEHEEVPIPEKKRGHKKWPVMVLGGVWRESVDKSAETCQVLDVIVSPTVMQESQVDKTGETKEEICVRVIDAIRAREKERYPDGTAGPPGGVLDKTFSLPKLSKVLKDICNS